MKSFSWYIIGSTNVVVVLEEENMLVAIGNGQPDFRGEEPEASRLGSLDDLKNDLGPKTLGRIFKTVTLTNIEPENQDMFHNLLDWIRALDVTGEIFVKADVEEAMQRVEGGAAPYHGITVFLYREQTA